ncbi:MAG: ATP-dependent helicase HrpB [Rhodovarius sp.]|nr:ATP-dependent helicase HrpB [Rhodovarius sp.]MDW8315514.1 ATP-dependent helicase HrpB [Rhodovarius sp.]
MPDRPCPEILTQPEPWLAALPVAEAIPALLDALARGGNAVLVAPPGAGKTTAVPLVLMRQPWAASGRILLLEPRRIAARAAARRMAELLGEPVGERIGLATRLERVGGPAMRVEVITEGLLVRRLQADPGLEGVAAILFDEAHERHLDTDLALAFCLDLQRNLRPELRLVAMSATLDGAAFATLMGAPVIESLGRAFPVAIRHRARDLTDLRELPEAMAGTIRTALAEEEGDILAFLPGWAEIRRTAERLSGIAADVLPLHGELPPAEQERALRPGPRRRVVLATSIAETSLTVPGVRIVVDGGFRRAPLLDPATGLSRLMTRRISRAAADQRAGRAGREGPGVAYRLWSEAQHRGLPLQERPEILEAELAGFALDCAAWGAEPAALPLLDQPPPGALAAARALLRALDALDADLRITPIGRRMARLGTHPRLARMMLAAADEGERALAADLAALLEEGDPIRDREAPSDIRDRIGLLHGADHPGADRAVLSRIRRAAEQHRRRLGVGPRSMPAGDAGALLAAGFPDRIAARRGALEGAFRLAGLAAFGGEAGPGARTPPTDPLRRAPLLAVAALEPTGAEARIRLAAPLELALLEARFPERLRVEEGPVFDPRSGVVQARRRRFFGPLLLEDGPAAAADPVALGRALAEAAAARGFRDLTWSTAARQTAARIAWMRRIEGEAWPDGALSAEMLAPWLTGMTRLADLRELDLSAVLRSLLTPEQRRRLDAALPARIPLPSGRSAEIDYTADPPRLQARAQDLYGLTSTPQLAEGRVPLHVALLSPAGRPIAITADLAGFWAGGWKEARKEMRGRYPKHHWPEDPTRP